MGRALSVLLASFWYRIVMRCPRCEFASPSELECLKCGIVFEKWIRIQAEEKEFEDEDENELEGDASIDPISGLDRPPLQQSRIRDLRRLASTPNTRELVNVYRSLGHLYATGVSPVESLQLLLPTLSKQVAFAIESLIQNLLTGGLLSRSMEEHPSVFDARLIAEIRGAERTGHFGPCFERAAARIEAKQAFKRELFRQHWGILVTFILSILILPIPSLVFGGGGAYASHIAWPLGILIGGYILIPRIFRILVRFTRAGDLLKHVAWRSPFPASLYVTWIRGHFAEDLSLHLETGHPIGQALDSVLEITEDPVLSENIHASLERGQLGHSLAEVLVAGKAIASIDAVQIAAGEKTGSLVASLRSIAAIQRERFQRGVRTLLRLLQVALVLGALGFVGWKTLQAYSKARKQVDGIHQLLDTEMKRLYRSPDGDMGSPQLQLEGLLEKLGEDSGLPEGYQPLSPE